MRSCLITLLFILLLCCGPIGWVLALVLGLVYLKKS